MLRLTRVRALGLGAILAVSASAACQVLAGIDEKTAATVTAGPDTGSDATTGPECQTHAECVAGHAQGWVCVKETHTCQSLFSADCDTVLAGNLTASQAEKQAIWANDDTLFLGYVGDLKGPGQATGIARRQAIALAVDALTDNHGIPGADGRRRPVAVVACSETKADGTSDPKIPAAHLVNDLHVPAIIGASNSDTTIELFSNAASPNALVFSPYALSSRLSAPTDEGLFWRTSAPDPGQALALVRQIGEIEQDLIANQGVNAGEAKLAIVYLGNGFGRDIVPQITDALVWNGAKPGAGTNGATCTTVPCADGQRILVKSYDDAADQTAINVGVELGFFKPHLVVAIGGSEAAAIARNHEAARQTNFPSVYLFAQGSATSDLTTTLTANDPDGGLRPRVRGVRQQLADDEATTFAGEYALSFPSGPENTLGVPGAYDITYLLAYAAVASGGDGGAPLSGRDLAAGLRKVLDGASSTTFRTTPGSIGAATDALAAGGTINVKGYSYTRSFDLDAGEAPGVYDVWCVSSAGNAIRSSGEVFDPTLDGGTTTGTFACPTN